MWDKYTQSQNEFKKQKKHLPMTRLELLMHCASRGGGGGAPDHSAIRLDGNVSSLFRSSSTPIGDLATKTITFLAMDSVS